LGAFLQVERTFSYIPCGGFTNIWELYYTHGNGARSFNEHFLYSII
jgi:hypothetical protein